MNIQEKTQDQRIVVSPILEIPSTKETRIMESLTPLNFILSVTILGPIEDMIFI